MFHPVPFISPTAAVATTLILLFGVMFALSFSPPGTAHADHSSPPTVKIKAVMPEVGEEGSYVTVTLQLSRQLTADEQYCYLNGTSQPSTGEVCIEGGINVWDTYDDHLYEEGGSRYDNGHVPVNEQLKFVFRGTQVEKREFVRIADDQCITPGRKIRIAINTAFDDVEDYGYLINTKEFTALVNGNDMTNGSGCNPVGDGVTEEADYNKAPTFDASENPPEFTVDENTAAGQDVGSPVSATDPESDTLTYSLQGTDAASFDIDSSSGQIKTKASLDHETKDTYHVAVFVRDSKNIHGNSDTVDDNSIDVKINVRDVNEPPVIDVGAPTALSVLENTAADEDVGSAITATDPDDGDTITYKLDDGDGATFAIDSSGQIKTKEPLDKETKDTYTVTVTVTDSGSLEDTHAVTITVTDDTTEPPTFNEEYADGESSITREVAENTAAGQPVGNPVSATDDDGDTLTYSLDTTGAESFDIDTATGQIKTKTGVDLDHETTPSYSVTVSLTDSEDHAGNTEDPPVEDATINVTINVTNVNEGPTFADAAPATQEVAENTAADTNIGSPYTATDPEGDTPLTYSLSGTDASSFAIDDTTGQLKTKADLDHETKDTYEVTIQVTDGLDGGGTTEGTATIDDTHEVTVTVTDADDEGELSLSSQDPVVNSALTTTLTDQDGGITGETWKWESSPDQNSWNVISGATTGSYTPDEDDVDDYLRVTVTYTDGNGAGKSAEAETSSKVVERLATNVNPSFADADTTRSVAENTAANTNIGAPVSATAGDSKGTLKYLLGGTDATSFAIDTTTGQLKTNAALDYEDKDEYTVTVSVSDELDDYEAADTVNDDSIEVTITVTDLNEPPAFDNGLSSTLDVAENTATDTNIGSPFTATDPDTTNDTLEYSLPTTGDSAAFAIDSASGQLKTKDPLDFESKDEYTVRIHVTDKKAPDGSASAATDATHTVAITVTDVDDEGELSMSNHPRVGAPLTAVLVDHDTGVENITWKWEKSEDSNDPWTEITGETSSSYTPVDDDLGDYLRVTVTYDDTHGTGHSIPKQASNAVVANSAPTFSGTTTSRSIAENTPSGRNIGAPVTATDNDTGIGDSLTYSLSGTNASSFSIVRSSGQLQTSAALDFETKDSYTVVVTATDTANATDTITVTINVTDVTEGSVNNGNVGGNNPGNNNPGNNNPGTNTKSPNSGGGVNSFITPKTPTVNQGPTFNDGNSTERWVAEMSPEGTNVGHPVRASDANQDSLTFYLRGTDAASFSIDSTNGQLKTKAELDFEIKKRYSVRVSVSDGKGGSDSIAVTIRVTDVVEVPVIDEDHQVVVLVDPDDETEVTTVGADGTVTFPEDTRDKLFFVRIDTNPDNCDWDSLDDPPAETLRACVTVEVFDTQGNPITGDNVLDPAISIAVVLDADDIGTDTIAAFLSSSSGWTSVTFTQTTDDDGDITVSIGSISGPGTYGIGSNAAAVITAIVPPQQLETVQQQTVQQETQETTPDPTPNPTATPQPTPTAPPDPTPTPVPQPTATPVPTATPQPTPVPPPTVPAPPEQQSEVLQQSFRVAPPSVEDLGNASGSSQPQIAFFGDDDLALRIWPVILIALGIAMELIALGLFLKEKEADKRRF